MTLAKDLSLKYRACIWKPSDDISWKMCPLIFEVGDEILKVIKFTTKFYYLGWMGLIIMYPYTY